MHIEPTLLNPACQALESVGIIMSSEGFALGPIYFPFCSSSQAWKHLVTKWRMAVRRFLGAMVLCTSYSETCRMCLCLTSAFYRDTLQYLHLPEASAHLLTKQQELWRRAELLDWPCFISAGEPRCTVLRCSAFLWLKIENPTATFQNQSRKRASTFYAPKARYSEFFADSNFCQALYSHWDPLAALQY